ncbi:Unannotated [Lentimonas sp. CC4]|nr:Unannotated [Lentimonas sp. CC4]CAA6683509.1 Unannotated [Lentimonas sp. CC6]CAA7077270.1 Unannotated [Lentimonas sp. CC4]CAA7171412.1 Unannotated [Lentimonas sp. CC21]CAA7182398.1 Unannotated [Lentimonas sp. CC8]
MEYASIVRVLPAFDSLDGAVHTSQRCEARTIEATLCSPNGATHVSLGQRPRNLIVRIPKP